MITMDDKYRFKDFGLIPLQKHEHPLTPNIENKTMSIPGMPGVWDFGSEMRERPFAIPLGIIDYDRKELQRKLNAFVAFLLDAYGKPRLIKISYDYAPEKFYYAKLSERLDPERLIHAGQFTLPLVAHDPYAYAHMNAYDPTEKYFYDAGKEYDTGLMYHNTTDFDWIYSKHYSSVYNYSPYATALIIEIEGTVINPRITHQETGKTLYLPSIQGQKMTVDRYNVKVDGKNKFTEVHGIKDFHLMPGENPLLFEGGLPNAKVTYKWLHKFV